MGSTLTGLLVGIVGGGIIIATVIHPAIEGLRQVLAVLP